LLTRERDAETWLFLGMMSAFPAILINSYLFPGIIQSLGIEMTDEALMSWSAIISAPLGEEICKGIAVAVFFGSMNSGKRGFQIGFTVGLGFDMIENLQYILISFGGGFSGFALTSLIRGIGSIPGHALWTGITGFAIGVLASKNNHRLILNDETQNQVWKLFDPKTGNEITHNSIPSNRTALTPIDEQPHEWFTLTNNEFVPKMQDIGRGIRPPSNVLFALLTAIFGHALWNGTAVGVAWFSITLTQSEGISIFATLITNIVMVVSVLAIGNMVLKGVAGEDETAFSS
ncbi:MAG: PrsW family glutamic-type intramembrane protease, partial [Candidatus Thermoplasmatota archaeon]|nr:PrsW family glutamic-type intramembrane protease [Candidatus Thermoplasmatota archaeon]